jgi:hypothetical protein
MAKRDPVEVHAMRTPLTVLEYGVVPPPSFQTVVYSVLDFEATVARLKAAIAAEDLWLIAEINPRLLLERAGYAINATRQLLFFHPRYMDGVRTARSGD